MRILLGLLLALSSWLVAPAAHAAHDAHAADPARPAGIEQPAKPRTIRYSVRVRGEISRATVRRFRTLAQETYDDPRGWSAKGLRFQRVSRGGAFTLWLSRARLVPSFSSACSAQWSCRAGRNVIINLDRWRGASAAWKKAGLALRDYRHLVVNHETGHWLGYGHASCPRRGAPAPVMMQQSKGTGGCRFNPWPTPAELTSR